MPGFNGERSLAARFVDIPVFSKLDKATTALAFVYACLLTNTYRGSHAAAINPILEQIIASFETIELEINSQKFLVRFSQMAQEFLMGNLNALLLCAPYSDHISPHPINLREAYPNSVLLDPEFNLYVNASSSVPLDDTTHNNYIAKLQLNTVLFFFVGLSIVSKLYRNLKQIGEVEPGRKKSSVLWASLYGLFISLLPFIVSLTPHAQRDACVSGLAITKTRHSGGHTGYITNPMSADNNYAWVTSDSATVNALPLTTHISPWVLGVSAAVVITILGLFAAKQKAVERDIVSLPFAIEDTDRQALVRQGSG